MRRGEERRALEELEGALQLLELLGVVEKYSIDPPVVAVVVRRVPGHHMILLCSLVTACQALAAGDRAFREHAKRGLDAGDAAVLAAIALTKLGVGEMAARGLPPVKADHFVALCWLLKNILEQNPELLSAISDLARELALQLEEAERSGGGGP